MSERLNGFVSLTVNLMLQGGAEMDIYDLSNNKGMLTVTLELPKSMIKDLQKYAEYHGRSAQVDLRLRLARSLERDHNQETLDQIRFGSACSYFTPSHE